MDKTNAKKKHNEELENQETVEQEERVDKELKELQERIEEFDNKYKRALADFQNLERRVRDERLELIRSANKDLLLRLLPVLDTLILAQQHSDDQSLKVSYMQFLDILKSEGVTKIETIGKVFDPHLMEVVATENGEENKVIKEMRAGYMLNDKLLRPAQVVVGEGVKN